MSPSQVQSGHAFEYGIACAFNRIYNNAILQEDKFLERAKNAFCDCTQIEKEKIFRASDEIAAFLIAHDKQLQQQTGNLIYLQSDMKGVEGDVRDVVIENRKKQIGISAKNRHTAVKHSRLSEKIDFGRHWFDVPCNPEYYHQIVPIFRELNTLKRQGILWNELDNKAKRFYVPILIAFRDEAIRLCKANSNAPKKMVEQMMGIYDFYKIIKENGDVSIQSFNFHGTLGWGKHIKFPTRLIESREKDNSDNTLIFTFDEGWQLSFRIHNAESKVVPSLKFDVQIIGLPNASQHQIHYG